MPGGPSREHPSKRPPHLRRRRSAGSCLPPATKMRGVPRRSGRGIRAPSPVGRYRLVDIKDDLSIDALCASAHRCLTSWLAVVGMSSSRKTMNEFASMFQDHVNWLGRYGSVPRRMALRIVNVQVGEVLDRIPRLLALELVVRKISWQWMHEAWDVVTGMTCESPRECAGTRKPIPSGMGGFTSL